MTAYENPLALALWAQLAQPMGLRWFETSQVCISSKCGSNLRFHNKLYTYQRTHSCCIHSECPWKKGIHLNLGFTFLFQKVSPLLVKLVSSSGHVSNQSNLQVFIIGGFFGIFNWQNSGGDKSINFPLEPPNHFDDMQPPSTSYFSALTHRSGQTSTEKNDERVLVQDETRMTKRSHNL